MAYQSSIRSYARRSYGTQTRRTRKPSYTRRSVFARTVRSGKGAVASLQNQITRLTRKVNVTRDTVQYKATCNDAIGTATGVSQYNYPLMKFSYWQRVFGAAADDETPNDCRIMKTNIDCEIETNGETENVDYTMYIVSLTKFGQQELLNPGTGNLNGPLANDVHYARRDDTAANQGYVFLNKKYFNVIKAKRLMTGVHAGNSTETASLRKRMYFRFSWNKGKGILHKNPSGDWKAKPCPQTANGNVFIILFNNDSTLDQNVLFKMTALHTVEV